MKRLFVLHLVLFSLFHLQAQTYKVFKGDTINRIDNKGLKQGLWRKYYSNDTLFSEGYYKNGKHSGTFRTFHMNGNRQSILIFRGLSEVSDAELYNDSAKLIARGKYIDHDKDSLWTYYDGNSRINNIELYKKGKPEGTWKMFYPNGQVAGTETYKNGKKNGPCKKFFENGKIKFEGLMVNGELEGRVVLYSADGKIWQQGTYKNGDKDGKWQTLKDDGSVEKEEIYINGILRDPPPEKVIIKEE